MSVMKMLYILKEHVEELTDWSASKYWWKILSRDKTIDFFKNAVNFIASSGLLLSNIFDYAIQNLNCCSFFAIFHLNI